MADKKSPDVSANKLAMSRALGAAFLNHQVEQLEKSVSNNGPASGNWRVRKATAVNYGLVSPPQGKRRQNSPGPKKKNQPVPSKDKDFDRTMPPPKRRSAEEDRKDADVIVVDASVLIHALYQLKKWCRDGREEIVIVPLEALNTLDLLKKGTSSLAQKARAASRILEAQVGTNPRIRVQRDDAFVLWDQISFIEDDKASNTCPEWVRRIICCACWETEHPEEEFSIVARKPPYKVVFSVVTSPPNMSPQSMSMKLADMSLSGDTTIMTPVPGPAPSTLHTSKFENRSSGSLVSSWAIKANIELLEVDAAEESDRPKRNGGGGKGRRASTGEHGGGGGGGGGGPKQQHMVERPPAVMAMMEMISQPTKVVRVLARGEKLEPDP